jgi:hypothetical protein
MQLAWFVLLLSSICFEGLGRKYLPAVPSAFLYFLKDAVLVAGYFMFQPPLAVRNTVKALFRGFSPWWLAAFAWTTLEMFNPENQSLTLGIIGLRSYWLWWLTPLVVATVLRSPTVKRRAVYAFVTVAVIVALLAVAQFGASPTSELNLYSTVDGTALYAGNVAVVSSTGRARVASTFSFLSGFVAFVILVPSILLSIGLDAKAKNLRRAALGATALSAAVAPMSGSRSAIVMGIAVLLITIAFSGTLFTRAGRRIILAGAVAATLSTVAFPEAFEGVQSRFDSEETGERLMTIASNLPPVALSIFKYPLVGIGTGMQQNARMSLGAMDTEYNEELEPGRYLVELGPFGYLLVWVARLGLVVALIRAYRILRAAKRRGAAAGALSYALLAGIGNLTFDHIWQALLFTGCGFILAEVVEVQALAAAAAAHKPVAVPR